MSLYTSLSLLHKTDTIRDLFPPPRGFLSLLRYLTVMSRLYTSARVGKSTGKFIKKKKKQNDLCNQFSVTELIFCASLVANSNNQG